MTQQAGETSDKVVAVPLVPLVGSKMRKKMAGSLQEHVSAPTSDFAKKQLEKMGWTAGTGLGKKRDGIVSHIKVQKRAENAGLGTERQAAEDRTSAESWWKDSLGDTLAKLGAKNGKKSRKRKDYTDEDLFEATGGARFGTKGGKLRQAKWRRTETESFDENKTGIPQDGNKKHEVMDSDKLFKEETLNEDTEHSSSDSKKKRKKEKKDKKKKSKKDKKDKKKKSKTKE